MSEFLNHLKKNGKKIDAEIAAVFEKYGIKVVGRSARVDSAEGFYKFKIQFATPQGAEARNKKAENNYRFYAPMSGLKEEWFGKKFCAKGTTYTICGFNPRRKKKPVELAANGKIYCAAPEEVAVMMRLYPAN